jgi:hypothetical protein
MESVSTMNIDITIKLYNIFVEKKWTEYDGNKDVFKKFCELLLNLNDEQQELIIDLVKRYTWISYSMYQKKIIDILNKVDDCKLTGIKKIILFPIMKPEDENKSKSGHGILVLTKTTIKTLEKYKRFQIEIIESYDTIKANNFILKETDTIFLLDDFLGSGETIKATIEEILLNKNIITSNINVISIAMQSNSIDYLKSIGVIYYTDVTLEKGITDYYITPKLEENVLLMKEIEKLIPGNHCRFGYNDSEALITLLRTPDNTFPIFWKQHKKSGIFYEAPFPN